MKFIKILVIREGYKKMKNKEFLIDLNSINKCLESNESFKIENCIKASDNNVSTEGIIAETLSAFGTGLRRSIFGPSKKEKEADNKKKELEAKKEAIYNNFKKEINFHTIFNIKHPNNIITKYGSFKCPSGKILMGDCDNFYEKGIVTVPKGNYNFELSRLIDKQFINALVFKFQLNKNKIATFKKLPNSSSIDGGVCSIAEGSDMNILISKSEDEHDDDSFYEDFDTFIQFELDDIGTFK